MSEFLDRIITCVDCQQDFTFTAGEQQYYRSKKAPDGTPFRDPKRCVECRRKKRPKYEREAQEA